MNILYIAPERHSANAAASALHSFSQNVTLTWARSAGAALGWLRDNRNPQAVIVDSAAHDACGDAFPEQVRELGVATPIAVIAPEHLAKLLSAVSTRLNDAEASRQRLVDEQGQDRAALARTTRICTALQERLLELEGAIKTADERHEADVATTNRLASRESELNAALTEAIAARGAVEDRLCGVRAANDRATEDLAAAVERCAALEGQLAEENAARSLLNACLLAGETARVRAEAHHAMRFASVSTNLTDVKAKYDALATRNTAAEQQLRDTSTALDDARARVAELERRLTDAEATHEEAQQRAAADRDAAAERYSDLEHRFGEEVDARSALQRQLTDAEAAHQNAQREWELARTAAAEQSARREAELIGALAEEQAARIAVERQLADAEATHQDARAQAAADLAAAAERHADLEDRFNEEVGTRRALEDRLADAERARERAEAEHAGALESWTARLTDLQAHYDRATQQIDSVERQLADAETAHQRAQEQAAADRSDAAARHADLEGRLVDAATARAMLEERVAAGQIERDDAERRHAGELATLRDSFIQLQSQHEATVTEGSREIAGLQDERDGLRRQLTAMRTYVSSLRGEALRGARLEAQLEESQKEIRRQFERAPYGLFDCTPDGAITRVNNVLARLLGYRGGAGVPREDLVPTVFECAGDLQWLLERVEPGGSVQSIDTTLKARDGRRLSVRLHASTSGTSVRIAVEDLTRLSTLEQRVRNAQRMEAVGRVASEVAVTCDTLLREVTRGGQLWLAEFASDTSVRQQGELLLGDVTRAAGLLRQFAVFGHTQITNVEPVSMPRVLREMKPVLERVLGDGIDLKLPKTTHGFDVDVEEQRVERILVNVANYARQRMPQGGRVRIHLATTVAEQEFLARYPRVRPGAHVLITISEVRGATRPALPIEWPITDGSHERTGIAATENPGMDLGPLMALISDLGGHLWMSVEPAGNMTLQIRLPRRTQDEVMEPAAAGTLATRGRQLARWFRH